MPVRSFTVDDEAWTGPLPDRLFLFAAPQSRGEDDPLSDVTAERQLDIVFGRTLRTKQERTGRVVGNRIQDPGKGESNDKGPITGIKIVDPSLSLDNKIIIAGDLPKPVQIDRLDVAAA